MKLKVFQSHEAMENDRLKVAAEMDPVEGLAQTIELILRAYGTSREELSLRKRTKKITFTFPE